MVIFVILVVFALIIICVTIFQKKTSCENQQLSEKDKKLRNISKIGCILWMVLIIPTAPMFFMFGVATIMSAAAPNVAYLQQIVLAIGAFLFFATPVVAIISLVLAIIFRKKEKFFISIITLSIPLGVVLLAFLLLIVGFVI